MHSYRCLPTFRTGYATNGTQSAYPNLWRGLVGLYVPSMGVQGGNQLVDFSGYRLPGVMTNMANTDWVGGVQGLALSFNGTNAYVNLGSVGFVQNNKFTMMAWVKGAAQALKMIIGRITASVNPEFYMSTGNSTTSSVRALVTDGTNNGACESAAVAFDGSWHHITAVLSQTVNGQLEVYVDGKISGSVGTSVAMSGSNGLYLGARDATPAQFFAGQIDDVRMWTRALSRSEIMQCFAGASPLIPLRQRTYLGGRTASAPSAFSTTIIRRINRFRFGA